MSNVGLVITHSADDPSNSRPPRDEIPGMAAGPPYVTRGPRTSVAIPYIQVFTTGLLIPLEVRFRAAVTPGDAESELRRLMRSDHRTGVDRLHLAVDYPDGTVTQNIDEPENRRPGSSYRSVLLQHAGSSGPTWALGYWIRWLPTAGTVGLTVRWPSQGVITARFELPSQAVQEAEARILDPWA